MIVRLKAALIFTLAISLNLTPAAASISHIHNVEVFGKKILLGTHEGLFEHKSARETKQIGNVDFDLMGLASFGSKLYASSDKDLYQVSSSDEKIVKLYSFPSPILGISANKSQVVVVTSKTLYISKDGAVSFQS
mgnify:FL=1